MIKRFRLSLILLSAAIPASIFSQTQQDRQIANTPPEPAKITIEGLVRDVACPVQNPDATATHLNMKCLRACVRKGSPLVILTKEGELYFPISSEMPDSDQRNKLGPYIGKYVRATGPVFERKGTRAIMIKSIEELKECAVKDRRAMKTAG